MRRMDRPQREPKKAKQQRQEPERVSKAVAVKCWESKGLEPLEPRACPYRGRPGHHLVSCPACEGFPLD
jgi:hypothetical protein